MPWEAWLTLAVVVGVLAALVMEWVAADAALLAGALGVAIVGELAGSERLPAVTAVVAGVGNPGVVTVGVLFVVVAGLTSTGALEGWIGPVLGSPTTPRGALARLCGLVAGLSSVVNNTPVVAMFLPVVEGFSKRTGVAPSQLYLPMAYSATFGGVCTLIGTSTNLVVNGLWVKDTGGPGLGMFDLAWVGVPAAAAGIGLMMLLAPRLLVDRRPAIAPGGNVRSYFVEASVIPGGPLAGKTVADAGLRRLPRLFLVAVHRGEQGIAPVTPRTRLEGGDVLSLAGDVDSVLDLRRLEGLRLEKDDAAPQRHAAPLVEAVVSDTCPLLGKTIREGHFRGRYGAAVVAVARGAQRVTGRLGDIVLRSGDTLLLEAGDDFLAEHGRSRDFYLVSGVDGSAPPRAERGGRALLVLLAMIALATTGVCDMLTAGCLAAGAMVALGCCGLEDARESIDWPLLLSIAASLGLGAAMQSSGLAARASEAVIGAAAGSPWGALAAVYLTAMVLTELVTNNAAAVLVYPIAVATARSLSVSETPFVVAVMVAASAGYATPFGYQTNLMVYGPGGYKFRDYVWLGLPLDLAYFAVTVVVAPWVFPFHS